MSDVTLTINTTSNSLVINRVGDQGADGQGVPSGGTTGQVLSKASGTDYDTEWITASGLGTVTSVALSVPTGLTVSGSPITASGTLAVALGTGRVIPLQSELDAKATSAQGALADSAVQPGDNVSDLTNDAGYLTSAPVSSVNSQTGAVVLDADDIDDTATANKFVTASDITKLGNLSGTNTGDQDLSGYLLSSTAASTYAAISHSHTHADITDYDTELSGTTNITAFTPSADYHPATKKYVDDAITASGGYTDEQAQDAVGGILVDSSEIDFTYNDATPSITASIVAGSVDETKLDTSVNASLDLADSALQSTAIGVSIQAHSAVLDATTASFTTADETKLDGIEAGADVTDTANVTAAGALMDSEVTNLAAVKAFDPTDYATAAQGSLADSALQSSDIGVSVQAYDVDTAKLDVAQEFTATQNFNATTLTDGATINWDLSANQVASVTLGGNRTLAAPTNLKDGATYILIIKQDATGSRTLTFNGAYKFPGGTAPTLTTSANAVDIISFVSDGTSLFGVAQLDFS